MLFELAREKESVSGFDIKPDPESVAEKKFCEELPLIMNASGITIGDKNCSGQAVNLGKLALLADKVVIFSPYSKSGITNVVLPVNPADARELKALVDNPKLQANIYLGYWKDGKFDNPNFSVRFGSKNEDELF